MNFLPLLLTTLTVLFPTISYAVESIVDHDLIVQFDPQQHHLIVKDQITLPASAPREIVFSLHSGLNPGIQPTTIKLTALKGDKHSLIQQFKIRLPEKLNTFTMSYQGVINHPLESYGKEQARGFRSTPGLISPKGVFLAASTYWFAQFKNHPYLNFNMQIKPPVGWKTVSQGERIQTTNNKGTIVEHWNSQSPQEEIYLIAAPFIEYNRTADTINAQVFLRQPDEMLAKKYLEATIQYLSMYEKLLGPYPYSKFALVENFWETGFGMPSFTLLGSKVIRFPFIINSSYPHEILHNWWGNGVYVDFPNGNWSEGLTAYLSDHLIKQQQGQAMNYRLQSLQKYSDYAAKDSDFPLSQFRGRHSTSSEAVGYGKTLMLFNMLRQQIGDELFIRSLQQFYQKYKHKIASFNDLKNMFEQVSHKRMDNFFQQWVERTGAPNLKLGHSEVTKHKETYQLHFELTQVQAGDAYQLQIPVAVTLQGEKNARQSFINMTHKNQQFNLSFTAQPHRLDIDPEFDLFRKLAIKETPPAFTQLFGADNMLVVLPRATRPDLKTGWLKFSNDLTKMGPDNINIKWDDELDSLPQDQAITILGWNNRFANDIISSLSNHGFSIQANTLTIASKEIPLLSNSIALTTGHQHNGYFPRSFIATDLATALPGLGRKLPHYHKYSYLAFTGDEPTNILKGRWPVSQSPMTVLFKQNTARGKLAERPALIESKTNFNANNKAQKP